MSKQRTAGDEWTDRYLGELHTSLHLLTTMARGEHIGHTLEETNCPRCFAAETIRDLASTAQKSAADIRRIRDGEPPIVYE